MKEETRRRMLGYGLVSGLILGVAAILAAAPPAQKATVWIFDRLDKIGGHSTTILGHPRVIATPLGKAIQFNGVDDAIYVNAHPLAGAATFTFEALFRPERGGAPEQRWFHLAEQNPDNKSDTDNRYLFETRLVGDNWYLDSFANSGPNSLALMNRERLHPLDAWYQVAMVYDGKTFSNYVNGEMEGKGEVRLSPQGQGHSSVGVRINRMYYFKGSVQRARFTPRALSPAEFLKVPARLRSGKR